MAGFKDTKILDSRGFSSGIGVLIFSIAIMIIFGFILMSLVYFLLGMGILYIILYMLYGTKLGIKFLNYLSSVFNIKPSPNRDLFIFNTLKKLKEPRKNRKFLNKNLNKIKRLYEKNKEKSMLQKINNHIDEIKIYDSKIFKIKREIVERILYIKRMRSCEAKKV
jgi:peptidoglycan hydrolase CwlO-like protein